MESLRIRKAVIPAAGKGTRLLPATAAVAKELLPVRLKPMIQHCLEEAIRSGLEEIGVILSPEKEAVRTYLEEVQNDPRPALREFRQSLRKCRLVFLQQPSPLGVADALRRAREFTEGEPFAVLLPDNICFTSTPPVLQMVPRMEPDRCALALIEYRRETAGWFGNCGRVDCVPEDESRFRITRLHDKGSGSFDLGDRPAELVGYARYILRPHFFDYLAQSPSPPPGGEWDDTPVLQRIIRERGMTGIRLRGEFFDAGNALGYAAANRVPGDRGVAAPGESL